MKNAEQAAGIGDMVHINLGYQGPEDGFLIRPAVVLGCYWQDDELPADLLVFTPKGTQFMRGIPFNVNESKPYHWFWPPKIRNSLETAESQA